MKAANRVLAGVKNPTHEQDQAIAQLDFRYSEVNFNRLIYEVVRLREARILDQDKIIKKNEELLIQKKQILELCKQLNVSSPLMVVYKEAK